MIKVATSKFVTSTGSSGQFMIALEMAVLTINRVLHPIIPWLLAAKKKLKVTLGGHLITRHLHNGFESRQYAMKKFEASS